MNNETSENAGLIGEQAELLAAEERRKQKAAATNERPVPKLSEILSPIDYAQRLEKLKPIAAENQKAAEQRRREIEQAQRQDRIDTLKLRWDAPLRQVEQLGKAYNEDPKFRQWYVTRSGLTKRLQTGFLLAMIGTRGSGKTQLAVELMNFSVERERSALYTRAMDFFMAIKRSYKKDSKETEESVCEHYFRPEFLVIDETHERAQSAWEDQLLTNLIDKRYAAMKDTLMIANQTKQEFESAMGKSVVARLNETGGFVKCDWPSFREAV